jgi:CubicO group peptidase (beta-lactamase class C family)
MDRIRTLMRQAAAEGVFPGAVLLVSVGETVVFHEAFGWANLFTRRPMTRWTVFDLASLTKPLATSLAIEKLVEQGRLTLETPIGEVWPGIKETPLAGASIEALLAHRSGLAPWRPYYRVLRKLPRENRRAALAGLLQQERPEEPPGRQTRYSDLGFMILAGAVETLSGLSLDRFVRSEILDPLGLSRLFFVDLATPRPPAVYAATEWCPWRMRLLEGVVHDDNAYVAGGVAGHAGLFGTAAEVHRLLARLLSDSGGRSRHGFFDADLLRRFLRRRPSGRALGFDVPSGEAPSCGRHFSAHSVGHLGFTGTSFWMDLERRLIVLLLTNRVHPSRHNTRIRAFRPLLHDTVAECLTALG